MGVEFISGNIVCFPDDGWYEPGLLEKVARYLSFHSSIPLYLHNVFDPNQKRSYGKRPLDVVIPVSFRNIFQLPTSAGIFVRAIAMKKAGAYFDERLGAGTHFGSGEEIDFIASLLGTDCSIIYNGNIRVYHPVPDYVEDDVKKYYQYGLGFGYLNGRLVGRCHLGVGIYFLEVLVGSLGGFLFNLLKPL